MTLTERPAVAVAVLRPGVGVFFFSSRRRHTRCSRDWSSDVCSSDLRVKKGFGSHSIPTAVVVQRQVASQKAGVGFTLHPLTGDREVIVIEGGYGQGEDVVSGRATPDTFLIDKKSGRLIQSRGTQKNYMK